MTCEVHQQQTINKSIMKEDNISYAVMNENPNGQEDIATFETFKYEAEKKDPIMSGEEQTTIHQAYESIDENLTHTHGLIYHNDSGEAQTRTHETVTDFHNIKHHDTIACDDIVSGGDGRIYDDPEISSEENTCDDIINQEVAYVNVNGTVTRREQVCAVEDEEEEEHHERVTRKMIHVEEEVPHKKKITHNYINQEIIDENVLKIHDKIERTGDGYTNAEENEQRALESELKYDGLKGKVVA